MADDRKIIPFGKYKGRPLEAMAEDKQYTDWLLAQPWFRERFESYYTIIVNNFGEPAETPDHNAMQAEWLDKKFQLQFVIQYREFDAERVRKRFIECCVEEDKERAREEQWKAHERKYGSRPVPERRWEFIRPDAVVRAIENDDPLTLEMFGPPETGVNFEVAGWDVVLDGYWGNFLDSVKFYIELKPTLGDDYPAVLRQIKARKENYDAYKVLLIREYTGVGATLAQVKQIFSLSGIKLILRSEVEDEI